MSLKDGYSSRPGKEWVWRTIFFKTAKGMSLKDCTLSETQAPFPLCPDLEMWGGGVGVLQEAYNGWTVYTVSQSYWRCEPLGGGGHLTRPRLLVFSCSISDCATIMMEHTSPTPNLWHCISLGFLYNPMEGVSYLNNDWDGIFPPARQLSPCNLQK